MGRLYSSTYYALHDTRTPLNFAIIRVILTSVLGYFFAIPLPNLLGIDSHWGGAGLTVSFGIAGWVEFFLLRRGMNERIGVTGAPASLMTKLWTSALLAGAAAFGVKFALAGTRAIPLAVIDLGLFGVVYGVLTLVFKVPEAHALIRRFRR
jgi:putative peptidoglycan lipid II flippase